MGINTYLCTKFTDSLLDFHHEISLFIADAHGYSHTMGTKG